MKLILSSSDFRNSKSEKFIHLHLGKPISDVKVLYFPNEKATAESIKSGMYEKRLMELGFQKKNIYVANYFSPSPFFHLKIDAVYISGGNTFGTMKHLRESGLDKAILNYVQNGAIYIGGSAGAHIATADISHVAKYDRDTFGLTDLSGLGLYNGILICHYSDERKDDFEMLKTMSRYPVHALSDEDSILVRDE